VVPYNRFAVSGSQTPQTQMEMEGWMIRLRFSMDSGEAFEWGTGVEV